MCVSALCIDYYISYVVCMHTHIYVHLYCWEREERMRENSELVMAIIFELSLEILSLSLYFVLIMCYLKNNK